MPYRHQLKATASSNPKELLTIWREERAFRIAKALCYVGIFLAIAATIADYFWSDPSVFITDFLLIGGLLLSIHWIRKPVRPTYYWWPTYWALWICELPSLWTTGGLTSPFFGVEITALFVVGAVMDSKNHSTAYMIFALLHIPVFYVIELFYPLALSPSPLPLTLIAIINGATLGAIFICLQAILRTEQELAKEFSNHYLELATTENSLKSRESQLREAQSIARIGNWEWDLKSDKINWSDELFEIFEVPKEGFDPSIQAYLQRLQPEMREKVQASITNSLRTGEDYLFENQAFTTTGTKYILSRGRVVRNADGEIIKLRGTSQDITDRKHIESQLMDARSELEKRVEQRTQQLMQSLKREKAAKEAAENASQAKMQFLANMSHEIRTPLNSIIGFSDLLGNGKNSKEDSEEYVSRIRSNGIRLLHLINDILDLSKFEAGQIPIHKSPIDLKSLIDDVINSFEPILRNKGLSFDLKYFPDENFQLLTDGHRLSQILTNLISNSVKFSNSGKIRMTVQSRFQEDPMNTQLIIDVEDSGIGISLENQRSLFQTFSQGDSSIARKFGGSGLGLALSKRIALAMEGTLELVKSSPGKGSHFRFSIPVEKVNEVASRETKQTMSEPASDQALLEFKDKRILLAEDAADNAFLICHYLRSLGVKIDVATDGLQALKMATQQTYDCILMDIQMPGMDGLEATRKIRLSGFKNPIIALTAHALPSESDKSIQAGCNLHLTKPIKKADLISTLGQQLKMSH